MSKDLFSELQDLGFSDIEDIDLFNKEKEKEEAQREELRVEEKEKSLLFDREVTCPVCSTKFKARSIKTSGYKAQKKDSDSFVHYLIINPYFYDVWICVSCGYAAMKSDFPKIKSYQTPLVMEKVTPKWQGKIYPETYDVNIAIERYKIALLNYFYIDAPASKKAMTCLKIAWMYRILGDAEKEITFLKQSIAGFNDAYFNEDFPIYEMDKFVIMYLMGELNRRAGNDEEAMSWFSRVITTPNAPQKLKEKARDQKDLIDAARAAAKKNMEEEYEEDLPAKKEGFFSKFFKK